MDDDKSTMGISGNGRADTGGIVTIGDFDVALLCDILVLGIDRETGIVLGMKLCDALIIIFTILESGSTGKANIVRLVQVIKQHSSRHATRSELNIRQANEFVALAVSQFDGLVRLINDICTCLFDHC